jgi:hypothetical protein
MDWKSQQKIDQEKQQRRATHYNLHGEDSFGQSGYQNLDEIALLNVYPYGALDGESEKAVPNVRRRGLPGGGGRLSWSAHGAVNQRCTPARERENSRMKNAGGIVVWRLRSVLASPGEANTAAIGRFAPVCGRRC